MRRRLILMRHAKSDWSHPGLPDKDRPLNARGRAAAPRMAHWLQTWLEKQGKKQKESGGRELKVDRVLSSTAVRTRETLRLMQESWGSAIDPQVEWCDGLYLAEPRVIWNLFRTATKDRPDESCLLVLGHNPGMEILISGLAGKDIHVPTAAIAIFQSPSEEPIGELVPEMESNHWELLAFQNPRSLSA